MNQRASVDFSRIYSIYIASKSKTSGRKDGQKTISHQTHNFVPDQAIPYIGMGGKAPSEKSNIAVDISTDGTEDDWVVWLHHQVSNIMYIYTVLGFRE